MERLGHRAWIGVIVPFLLALVMVALPSDTRARVSASVAMQPAQLVMRPTLPGVRLDIGGNQVSSIGFAKDYAGNRFDAYLVTLGNDTTIRLYKRSPAGVMLGQTTLVAQDAANVRLKQNSSYVAVDGDDVIVTSTAYEPISATRWYYAVDAKWENMAVPFPGGVSPLSGAGPPVYQGTTQEPPPGCDIDYEEIERRMAFLVDTRIRPYIEEWARTTIANMIPKTKLGVEQLFNFEQGSAIVYQQLLNTSYSGASEALRVYGACRIVPIPTP